MKCGSSKSGVLKHSLLVALLLFNAPEKGSAQDNPQSFVRLFRLEGSFGTELSANLDSDTPGNAPFSLRSARLEADPIGFVTRLRSVLTIGNADSTRKITEVQWRIDVYDKERGSLRQRALQTDKVNIYPGETASVSSKFGAVLPDRMVILLQLTKITFSDGPAWSSMVECWLAEDLAVSCKSL